MNKSRLRQKIKTVLRSSKQRNDTELAKHLFDFLQIHFNKDCIIGGYYPFQQEPDWKVDRRHKLYQWAFPRPTVQPEMMEYRLSSVDELEMMPAFGTKMPIPSVDKQVVVPDLLLVPGLAFGRQGERLGRGGGFFDRYIAKYAGTLIGLCFEIQLLDELPMQQHDCWMNYVITEREVYQGTHS